MSDAYGRRLGERMRAEHAQAIIARGLCKADLAVTEVRSDRPSPAMSGSIQREDAFLVCLLLRDFPRPESWEDGRQAPVCDLRAGEIIFADLKRDPAVLLDKPYHSLHFICRAQRWTRSLTTPTRRALVTLAIGPSPARALSSRSSRRDFWRQDQSFPQGILAANQACLPCAARFRETW
jgi:hypothetical protein